MNFLRRRHEPSPGRGPRSAAVPRDDWMAKELAIDGVEMSFVAPADDHYLTHMGRGGPIDLLPIFDAFCSPQHGTVDVGANIGITATIAARRSSAVIAVEPIPETFACLRHNVDHHGLDRVHPVRCAAGASPSVTSMFVHKGWGFGAFVGYEDAAARYVDFSEIEVPVRTLDDIADELRMDSIAFIKTDTEGFELEVLAGARDILRRDQPVVFLEVNHYCLNVFRRMSIVTFTEEVCGTFESVYAVDLDFQVVDLQQPSTHQHFFHENVVNERFPNLLCGPRRKVEHGLAMLPSPDRGSGS